jgi:Na+/alanine symporter
MSPSQPDSDPYLPPRISPSIGLFSFSASIRESRPDGYCSSFPCVIASIILCTITLLHLLVEHVTHHASEDDIGNSASYHPTSCRLGIIF